ncbi:MAG: hypothetical protein M1826_003085 [Phylliscum demangeonii]|nr:MAG: hypothetical protein M1826_003085 [Phylliscum demangeonii]
MGRVGKKLPQLTIETLREHLEGDSKVKVAGIDVDGILRGKLVSKDKFLSIARDGFGFCSIIFGWDMHDQTYFKELKISNKENGYRDLLAVPDLASYRRIPWEDDVPFFLLTYLDPATKKPISACPRGLLKAAVGKLQEQGLVAMAGVEYEIYHFAPSNDDDESIPIAEFLKDYKHDEIPPLTEGMFGYSLTRPVENQEYYHEVFDTALKLGCDIESWHTETGPGVFEAALAFRPASEMADRAALFKFMVKALGANEGVTPCFMAKPRAGLPGSSGHVHVSIVDQSGANLFAREAADPDAPWADLQHVSDMGRHFLAGLLDGLPDVMPLLAPTINSYKRLVENFWAPVTVSWGLEHRAASIRVLAPPITSSKATRFEVRVPGADANPHLVLAAILALGWRGVEKKMKIDAPPLGKGDNVGGAADGGLRLARSLKEANDRFMRKESVAREVFDDEFVDHFGGTRAHEVKLWDEAVTDWEVKRYIETV